MLSVEERLKMRDENPRLKDPEFTKRFPRIEGVAEVVYEMFQERSENPKDHWHGGNCRRFPEKALP